MYCVQIDLNHLTCFKIADILTVHHSTLLKHLRGIGVFLSHTNEGQFNCFCWNVGLNNNLVECSSQLLQNICKIMRLVLWTQRRKIITTPLNIMEIWVFYHTYLGVKQWKNNVSCMFLRMVWLRAIISLYLLLFRSIFSNTRQLRNPNECVCNVSAHSRFII